MPYEADSFPFSLVFRPAQGLTGGPAPSRITVGPLQQLVAGMADQAMEAAAVDVWYTLEQAISVLDDGDQLELPAHHAYLRKPATNGSPLVVERETIGGGPACLRVVLRNCSAMAEEMIAHHGAVIALPPTTGCIRQFLSYRRYAGGEPEIGISEGGRLACSLFGALADRACLANEGTGLRSRLVQLALRAIRARLHQAIGVGEIAAEIGVSSEHLARLFAKELGESPGRIIAREKMRRARELLKDTRLAVGTVAQRLGYASASHFTRCFRAEYELSPSEYRAVASVGLP